MEAITRNLNDTNDASQHKLVTFHVIKVIHEGSESFILPLFSVVLLEVLLPLQSIRILNDIRKQAFQPA